MKHLSLDLETYSSVDLSKCGVYKYSESPDFEILLFAYSVDGGPVEVVDLKMDETIPAEILTSLSDETVIKHAFNASFERVCLSRFLGLDGFLNPRGWQCTMVWGATLGLPLSLVGVGAVLGLDKQKLTEGKDLIRYFCVPCNPTKVNGGRTRNLPHHAPTKWSAFKTYNSRDVEVEIAIQGKLSNFPVLDSVWKEYWLDQEINDRGIEIDKDFVEAAVQLDELSKAGLNQQLQELTGLENPNSVLQMRGWLLDHGLETESLGKKAVAELLEQPIDENLKQVLVLRQQLAKSSVKKYQAMQNFACSDNRSRGLFQFYGANRTGRFAGRGIQLQNLPQNHMSDLSEARSLVKQSNFEMLNILYGNVPNVLSELLRTAFVPREGMKFIVSDFSAIEARVIAWLSGEKWRQEVFKNGGDIYCASASQMFGVPVEKHGVNGHLRQKGKIAELALGYGGSVGALKAMDALEMGLTEDELQPLVNSWRDSNINITELWWAVDKAVSWAYFWDQYGMNEITYVDFVGLIENRHLVPIDDKELLSVETDLTNAEVEEIEQASSKSFTVLVDEVGPNRPNGTQKRKFTGRNTDWERVNKSKQKTGALGEEIVLDILTQEAEKHKLKLPEHVSKTEGDGLGYDIRAFDESGNEIHIEVKASKTKYSDGFEMSANEVAASLEGTPYKIYFVHDLDVVSKECKIKIYDGPFTDESFKMIPSTYKIYQK
ncbi:DNA polymerase [Enterococcus hirae]|uniref:DNA polymerase n=3 Tax=Bacteria TaxID=2 RepID=UPI002890217C|nr:DNA polymerase [Enterococcus hirae]MDT2648850.1 DNA polymerase [Enterococcus hirae]